MIVQPISVELDEANISMILWYIHFLAVFLGLAYLPFSKMFHIITTPISLLANAVMEKGKSDPINIITKQIMELDACTHCGTCSLRCSALAVYNIKGNRNILPSEKMSNIKKILTNEKKLENDEMKSIYEGIYLCTNCDRCTVVCPSGINLRDLWFQVKEELIHRDYPLPYILSPLSFSRGLIKNTIDAEYYSQPIDNIRSKLTSNVDEIKRSNQVVSLSSPNGGFLDEIGLSNDKDAGTYSQCFSCCTCSSSCPVVGNYDNPMEELGLLPHQVIHSAVLGNIELALGSSMLWDCLTCYKCQENCPQGVQIADVFYKLKNLAVNRNQKVS